jgi:hypothetical protein
MRQKASRPASVIYIGSLFVYILGLFLPLYEAKSKSSGICRCLVQMFASAKVPHATYLGSKET